MTRAVLRVAAFLPQNLSNMSWALAPRCVMHDPLFDAISACGTTWVVEFENQGLSSLSWAYATLAIINMPLMYSIAHQFLSRLSEARPQDMANGVCICTAESLGQNTA